MAARGGGLVPFGTNSSHAFFCWDSARTDRRGESPIVLVDNAGDLRVATIAKDLYGLMRNYRQALTGRHRPAEDLRSRGGVFASSVRARERNAHHFPRAAAIGSGPPTSAPGLRRAPLNV